MLYRISHSPHYSARSQRSAHRCAVRWTGKRYIVHGLVDYVFLTTPTLAARNTRPLSLKPFCCT